jgi:hypothetical protein
MFSPWLFPGYCAREDGKSGRVVVMVVESSTQKFNVTDFTSPRGLGYKEEGDEVSGEQQASQQ